MYALTVHPDGKRIIVGGGSFLRWLDRHTGAQLNATEMEYAVLSLATAGQNIVCGDSENGVWTPHKRSAGKWAPIGRHGDVVLAVSYLADVDQVVSAGRDGVIAVWDWERPEPVWRFPHSGPVLSLAVGMNSRVIVSGGLDGTITLWDRETGARRGEPIAAHAAGVHALAATPDGTHVVSAGGDGVIQVWHLASGRAVGASLTGHTGAVYALSLTPDGTCAVSGGADGTVRVWDLATRQQIGEPLTGEYRDWLGPVSAVVVTPDGNGIFAATRSGAIHSWERTLGRPPRTRLGRHRKAVYSVAMSPDSITVVSASRDCTARLWPLPGGPGPGVLMFRSSQALCAVSVSPANNAMIGGGTGEMMRLALAGQTEAHSYPGQSPIYAIATVPDGGGRVVVGCADGTVRDGPADNSVIGRHDGPVYAVAVTHDGDTVVSASSDGTLRVWRDSKQVGEPLPGHTAPYQSVAVTPDGKHVASGFDDGTIRIWQLETREPAGTLTGHTSGVLAVAMVPGGVQLVSGGADGTVRIWDLATGTQVGEPLTGHTGMVHSVAVSPDATTIVSGGEDGQVLAWDRVPVQPQFVRTERAAGVLTDAESDEDRLGMTADVHTMAALLAAKDTAPPLSVALLGNWGTGKSTFMRLVADRIKDLAKAAAANPASGHVANVRQVRFNAWHYSDDHLWVGLVEQLFRGLHAPAPETPDGDRAKKVTRKEADLAAELARQARLDRTLAEVDELDPDRGWWGWFGQLRRGFLVLRQASREARQQIRVGLVAVGVLLVLLGIAAVVFGRQLGVFAWVGGAVAAVVGLLSPVLAVWQQIRKLTESARTKLLADRKTREATIHKLETELNQLDPARQLDNLLAEITATDRYESYRGLTGRIHHDLQRLSDELDRARKDGNTSLQRIILYIDDLDRCVSTRVVEVLQAINLLLSMPLFVVVVAVDPRWLLRALEEHHGKLLNAKTATDQGRPLDYLDKIFHVPYAVRPVGDGGVAFLRALLPDAEAPRQTPQPRKRLQPKSPPVTGSEPAQIPATPRQPAGITRSTTGWRVVPHSESATTLTTEGLRLRQAEADFLPQLAVLLNTPRSIKKLANLYRLLRIGVPDTELEDFIGDGKGGPYQAAALLLAAIVANPGGATGLLTGIAEAAPDKDIATVVRALDHGVLADLIEEIAGRLPVRTDAALYKDIARTVARYSFETYHLFTAG